MSRTGWTCLNVFICEFKAQSLGVNSGQTAIAGRAQVQSVQGVAGLQRRKGPVSIQVKAVLAIGQAPDLSVEHEDFGLTSAKSPPVGSSDSRHSWVWGNRLRRRITRAS